MENIQYRTSNGESLGGMGLASARRRGKPGLVNVARIIIDGCRRPLGPVGKPLAVAIIVGMGLLLLMPIGGSRPLPRPLSAKIEMADLVDAVEAYYSMYGRFPVSDAVLAGTNRDFTFGGTFGSGWLSPKMAVGTTTGGVVLDNAEVSAILMDLTVLPNGQPTVNTDHHNNRRQTIFLGARLSGYDPAKGGKPLPGVDVNGVFRDPWGNPYFITVNLAANGWCRDAFYSQARVSQVARGSGAGLNGLVNPDPKAPDNDGFAFPGKVMVWSAGPDGKVDAEVPADQGVNRDNILSWR